MNDIHVTAYGSTDYVGRSAFLLSDKDHKILLDCGLQLVPKAFSIAPKGVDSIASSLDAVLLSHAHIDHSGYMPSLSRNGYRGNYFMTHPTKEIAYRLWLDHLKIEGRRHWGESDLDRVFHKIRTLNYNTPFKLADGITAEFINAGHVLGAAQILIDWEGTQILYTADINNRVTPMFDGFDIPEEPIDVLLTESTNGDRYVPERSKINVGLKLIAKQLTSEKHKMILPSFAVGRSQETLITLALDNDLSDVPVYIDGMINIMNMITENYLSEKWVSRRFLEQLKEANLRSPFERSNFIPVNSISDRTQSARRYIARNSEGSIIVTTSGMLEGGPVHTYLELCGDNEENVIGFTGYQVEGTLGRSIYDGERNITLESNRGRKKDIVLKSKVMKFPYSGHSSVEGLKQMMQETKAQDIILVHGDRKNQEYILNYVNDIAQPRILQEGVKSKLLSA